MSKDVVNMIANLEQMWWRPYLLTFVSTYGLHLVYPLVSIIFATYLLICRDEQIHFFMHTHTHTHTHTCTHTHARTHARTHAHGHAHAHILSDASQRKFSTCVPRVDRKSTVYAWNVWLFATCESVRKSVCKFSFRKLTLTCVDWRVRLASASCKKGFWGNYRISFKFDYHP